jgi:prevent-host-death family protein
MKTVGAFEGKTHFSALIDEASRGETIIITKNGRPVAQLGPVQNAETFAEAIDRIQKMKLSLGMPIRQAIEEGRRF